MKSREYIIAGSLIAVLIIAFALLVIYPQYLRIPQRNSTMPVPSTLKALILPIEGKYEEALKAADDALALNVTSLVPLIQSNRAGILVMLGRNREAIICS